jgi:diguanylate cyclase (GGDEF)-like protein
VLLVDLDRFADVNREYGHQGGDLILRKAADLLKPLGRGRDMVARARGDTFAIVLHQTTLHDALPVAERIRTSFCEAEFSHGTHPLRITVSIGIAQLRGEELREATTLRASQALEVAQAAGGNTCFRHDGENCHAVSSAFQVKPQGAAEETLSLAALWRDATTPASSPAETALESNGEATLTGRSLFAANLGRRLAEWKRGGACVSVATVRVDQMDALVARFGEQGHQFLRQVLGRLLEATTRDMDERCEFEDGLFALLLPGADEANALAIADRLCSQVRQCKVRMGQDLWDLTASIGVAHCTVAERVMDIVLNAEAAMRATAQQGGDAVLAAAPIAVPRSTLV